MHVHVYAGALELESLVVVSCPVRVLGTKLGHLQEQQAMSHLSSTSISSSQMSACPHLVHSLIKLYFCTTALIFYIHYKI